MNLAGWPVERLEALGRILYEAFPTADDPDYSGAHWVTAEDELRNTRGSVVAELLRREAGGAEALARLANADVGLRQWLDNNQARRKASAAVAGLVAAKSFVVPSIPTAEAVRLLDQADYRLVRSADDLLQAVCEVLRRIDRDIAADLPMLYSSPGLKNSEASGSRKHLGEDAIQAYVRRRLTDLLPALIQGAEVVVVREDQVRYRRRLDLRVVAPCLGGKETATVVLELKWSDNRETEAGLEVQLGRKYLLGEGLTHGVYLVAWCGHWHRKGSGRQNDRISLESHLDSQVGRYCGQGPGKGLTIRPLVLGAEWHDPAD